MASRAPGDGPPGSAASDARQLWQGCTVESKATFLHLVDEVEARWRRERLPRSRSAPAALAGACPGSPGEPRYSSRTQRRRQQRWMGKKRRRGEFPAGAAEPCVTTP